MLIGATALGIAILGSVGTAVYRRLMADAVPAGLPADTTEAAQSTLGGALDAALQLPDPVGPQLASNARDAFSHAFDVTASIGAAIVILTAILAAILLRRPDREQQLHLPPGAATAGGEC